MLVRDDARRRRLGAAVTRHERRADERAAEGAAQDQEEAARVSQKRWLERQLNDPYVARAKREGFRSRAAFKLIEIDDKHRVLKPGGARGRSRRRARRLERDRGEARRRGGRQGQGRRDRHPRDGADPGRRCSAQLDFLDPAAPEQLNAMLGGGGRRRALRHGGERDRPQARPISSRSWRWSRPAAEFAREVLAPGGSFLAKVLQGGTDAALLAQLKRDFASVKHVKPQASRADSSELYLLATGFQGRLSATPLIRRIRRRDRLAVRRAPRRHRPAATGTSATTKPR